MKTEEKSENLRDEAKFFNEVVKIVKKQFPNCPDSFGYYKYSIAVEPFYTMVFIVGEFSFEMKIIEIVCDHEFKPIKTSEKTVFSGKLVNDRYAEKPEFVAFKYLPILEVILQNWYHFAS